MTEVYDNSTQNMFPILTVIFPPAVDNPKIKSEVAGGFMNCVRANVSRAGSRVAPPLPAPTALRHITKPLSNGAIAGISVAAALVGLLLLGLLVWWFWRKRRNGRDEAAVK